MLTIETSWSVNTTFGKDVFDNNYLILINVTMPITDLCIQ